MAAHAIPSPVVSLGKILELALNDGMDPGTKKPLGPPTGDPRSFSTYADFENAVKQQIDAAFKLAADMHNVHMNVIRQNLKMPFVSALMNDCIKRGRDLCDGGMRYLDLISHIDPVGHTDMADSMTAIRKLIYEESQVTWDELLEALSVNFEGKDDLRKKLLAAPKFGNDDDYADQAMVDIHAWTEAATKAQRNPWGKPFGICRQGGGVHLIYGPTTGALPNGRKAWEPFADGSISPMKGMDKKGLTAVFNSVAKVPTLGSDAFCLNQKLTPTVLQGREGKTKLLSAIKSYFDRWCYHVQFNIVDHNVLLEARRHPDQYRDLVVRVAGYSAFWVDLTPEVQDEIIARSLQTLS
jgi:formate C-acetyltransferase